MKKLFTLIMLALSLSSIASDSTKRTNKVYPALNFMLTPGALNHEMFAKQELYQQDINSPGYAWPVLSTTITSPVSKNDVVNMGLSFAMTGYTTGSYQYFDGQKIGTLYFEATCIQLISRTNFHWIRGNKSTLYSGAGIGFRITAISSSLNRSVTVKGTVPDDKLETIYDITLIGARGTFGKTNFGYNSEFGFGANGIIRLGLFIQFK